MSFHAMGRRCFLFDAAAQVLYRLNRIGAFIWCLLAEGRSPAQIPHDLCRVSGGELNGAGVCVHDAVRTWTALGFVTVEPSHSTHSGAVVEQRKSRRKSVSGYRILGSNFAVRFADARLERLGSTVLDLHGGRSTGRIADTLFVRRLEGDRIAIGTASETLQMLEGDDCLAPAVFASLMRLALAQSAFCPALHAASLRLKNGIALFPAASGSGKSTLMAALIGSGAPVLGDDTVVFERDILHVRPLTPLVCVKSGSWEIVAERVPDFMGLPGYSRADGARVRYLRAPNVDAWDRADPVRKIIFPRYRRNASTRIARVGKVAAFQRLLPDLDPIGRKMSPQDIDNLIAWIGGIDCYALTYGSLDDALHAIDEVVS